MVAMPLETIAALVFPDMRLRSASAVVPITAPVAPAAMLMPVWLDATLVPLGSTPMKLPMTDTLFEAMVIAADELLSIANPLIVLPAELPLNEKPTWPAASIWIGINAFVPIESVLTVPP